MTFAGGNGAARCREEAHDETSTHHRRGLRVALLTSLALAVPVALVEGGTVPAAHSAAASGDCAVAYPTTELTAGQRVNGLTVSQGVTPAPFTGEVLGVLKDGVLPGIDLVMARLDSTDDPGGRRHLAGHVGLAGVRRGRSPHRCRGLRPLLRALAGRRHHAVLADADVAQPAPCPQKVAVGDHSARLLARTTGVTRAQAQQGFSELPTPLAVAGVPAKILDRKPTRPYLPKSATVAGAAPAAVTPTSTDIVAGGNLGVTFSTGDITQGAFGTVTSVCNGLVRGFGHPFNLLGKTTYGLSGAETLYIQEDPVAPPFTVANFGPTLGTITQDRYVGVSGPLGVLPTGATVTNVLNHGPDLRTSQSVVTVQDALAQTTNYAIVVNHLRVLDAFPPGAEVQSWTITGHDGSVPFTLRGGNRYADTYDIAGIAQWDLPDLVWALGLRPRRHDRHGDGGLHGDRRPLDLRPGAGRAAA